MASKSWDVREKNRILDLRKKQTHSEYPEINAEIHRQAKSEPPEQPKDYEPMTIRSNKKSSLGATIAIYMFGLVIGYILANIIPY